MQTMGQVNKMNQKYFLRDGTNVNVLYKNITCKNGKTIILPVGSQSNVEKTDFAGSPFYNVIGMYFLSHNRNTYLVYKSKRGV